MPCSKIPARILALDDVGGVHALARVLGAHGAVVPYRRRAVAEVPVRACLVASGGQIRRSAKKRHQERYLRKQGMVFRNHQKSQEIHSRRNRYEGKCNKTNKARSRASASPGHQGPEKRGPGA